MSLLRRLRPRRDPLRELLEARLNKLRAQAVREPYKVGSLDVVALWIALKANHEIRRVPPGVIASAMLTLALLIFMLALRPVKSEIELSGLASGFSFGLASGEDVPLFPPMTWIAVTATGLDRVVIDRYREIAVPYLVAQAESQPRLLAALRGIRGGDVRIHRSDRALLRFNFETAEPVRLAVMDASHVVAGGDAEDLLPALQGARPRGSTMLELFPAAGERLELEVQLEIGSYEMKLAQEVPIRSLRFVETSVDHDHPEWSRTVGTLGEATLKLPAFPMVTEAIGRGARLELGDIRGYLEYRLTANGDLGFRYQGRVERAETTQNGTEVRHDLIPSWLEILLQDRKAAQGASFALAVMTAIATLLQLRRLP